MGSLTDIEQIYSELENSGVLVANIKMNNKAVTVYDGGNCIIGIDERQYSTKAELKTVLLHEQAHCETGSFYDEYTTQQLRRRLEYRTDKRVSETKITKSEINEAHNNEGLTEIWEFAEYFNVTVEYMKRMFYIHFRAEFIN